MDSVEQGKNLFVSEEIWIAPYYNARTEQAKKAGARLSSSIRRRRAQLVTSTSV